MVNQMSGKKYLVFTSVPYRFIMFGLIPSLTVGVQAVVAGKYGNMTPLGAMFCLALAQIWLVVAEVVSDTWLFGGILSKDAEKIDFLKTSPKGMTLMKNAFVMDLVRRFAAIAGSLFLNMLILKGVGVPFFPGSTARQTAMAFYVILLTFFFSVLGVFFSRFWGMLWINLTVSYLAGMLAVAGWLVFDVTKWMFACDAVLTVLSVGLCILTVKTGMRKVKGSYYDK